MEKETEFDLDAGVAAIAEGLNLGKEEETDPPETPEVPETPEKPETPEPVAQVRAAPSSWAKETHELWATLDPKVQDQIERREKQMLEGLTQYRDHNDFGKTMREVFTPYKQILQQHGLDETKAAQYLLAAHTKLITLPPEQKFAYWSQIAQNYGIQIPGQNQPDPRFTALEQTVQTIAQAQTEREQREYQEAYKRVSTDVNAFADAKDEKGNLKHPYFNDVADDIIVMIRAGMELQEAHDRAVWANPVTRAKEQARLKTEAERSLRERSKQETTAARQASSANVRSRDTKRAPTEPLGKMEDTMKETLADIKARAH